MRFFISGFINGFLLLLDFRLPVIDDALRGDDRDKRSSERENGQSDMRQLKYSEVSN